MSSKDNKTTENEGKLRLADGSADGAIPSPPPGLIGNIRELDAKKTSRGDDGLGVPGAFSVGHSSNPTSTSDSTPERTRRRNEKFKNLRSHDRSVPATESSDVAHQDDMRSERNRKRNEKFKNLRSHDHRVALATESSDVARQDNSGTVLETNLVEAEIAKDVDVEALLNERIQQMTVGVAAPLEVKREEDEDDEEQEEGNRGRKFRNLPLIILVGVVVVVGGAVGGIAIALVRPSAAARAVSVGAILADLAPWNQEAITWLTETDTWEPEDGDPNSDYLWRERYVMADLYYTTNGPNWRQNNGWLSAEPVCNWYFDWYFDEGRQPPGCPGPIKKLDLSDTQLTGSIPSSIGSLTQLLDLFLGSNQLRGSIPQSIGSLNQLTQLFLADNKLTGSIPSSIGSMAQLSMLYFWRNQLTGSIPSSIGSLTELSILYLDENKFSGTIPVLPSSVSSCWLRSNCFQDTRNGEAAGCRLETDIDYCS